MKRCLIIIVSFFVLLGCSKENAQIEKIVELRDRIQSSKECRFEAAVTLDYGDSVYSFRAICATDEENNMSIDILEPASISGVRAQITGSSGKLTFDEEVLAFEMIANDQITPICVPWLLIEALRGGYINACGSGDHGVFARIDDSFNKTEFSIEVWLDSENVPCEAEMLWEGKRIVSIQIDNFTFV